MNRTFFLKKHSKLYNNNVLLKVHDFTLKMHDRKMRNFHNVVCKFYFGPDLKSFVAELICSKL